MVMVPALNWYKPRPVFNTNGNRESIVSDVGRYGMGCSGARVRPLANVSR